MILLSNIDLPLGTDFSRLREVAARELKTDLQYIRSASLYRRSVDARRRDRVHFCCSLLVDAAGENRLISRSKKAQRYVKRTYAPPVPETLPQLRPVVVGFGPAGMFAGLTLSRAGLHPVIIERGKAVEERAKDVERFWSGGELNEESNVQFGEGGAGTFSDGKLNTGIKDVRCRAVLEDFVRFGAPEDILINAKPHIGTDILPGVVKRLREEIISLGGEVRFETRLENIITENGAVCGIEAGGERIDCNRLILACGHSARDTFELLRRIGIALERKPFSVGVRIEHLQSDINRALYGRAAGHPALGAADYKLAVHLKNGRGVYTFCMCPGGSVINASSESGHIAVNGMSGSRRDGKNANSAVLVGVDPGDFQGDGVLAGCELQRKIEAAAFRAAGGAGPVTTVGEFLGKGLADGGTVEPTVRPKAAAADFSEIFPDFIIESLKAGLPELDKKLPGFANAGAVLTAPETRSSSPVRITRNGDGQSVSAGGLFPCGEGAGYAGGITSAAVDGIRAAEAVICSFKKSG